MSQSVESVTLDARELKILSSVLGTYAEIVRIRDDLLYDEVALLRRKIDELAHLYATGWDGPSDPVGDMAKAGQMIGIEFSHRSIYVATVE